MADFYNLFDQQPSYIPSLLGEDEADKLRRQAQQSGLMNLGLSLLAGAGPQPQRTGIGQLLAQGVMAGQQASRNAYEQAVRDKMMQEQINERQQMLEEQRAAKALLPQILRPGQEMYGEDIMGQRVGVGVGAPQLDLGTLQKLLTTAPGVASKVLPTIETYRKLAQPEMPKLVKLGPEEQLIREDTGQVFATGGLKVEKPAGAVLEAMQVLGITKPMAQLSPMERKQIGDYIDRKEAAKSPKVSVDLSDPTAVAKSQLETIGKWENFLKDSGDMVVANRASAFYDAYRQASQPGKEKNVAADGAMIYNIAKIYDPTGAVQQGDIKTIIGNRSIPTEIQLIANKLQQGGSFTQQERENLKKVVDGIVKERSNALEPSIESFGEINKTLGGRPNAIRNPYSSVMKPRKSLDEILKGQ